MNDVWEEEEGEGGNAVPEGGLGGSVVVVVVRGVAVGKEHLADARGEVALVPADAYALAQASLEEGDDGLQVGHLEVGQAALVLQARHQPFGRHGQLRRQQGQIGIAQKGAHRRR